MKTLINIFEDSVKKYSKRTLIREHNGIEYKEYSYFEIHKIIKDFSLGLIHIGVKKDTKISLILEGVKEWLISELSIFYCGAISVPISVKIDELTELKYRIEHSESEYVIVSTSKLQDIRMIKNDIPFLKKIIVVDVFNDKPELNDNECFFEDLIKYGKNDKDFSVLEMRLKELDEDSVVNICYTSGTTSAPKGIMLSHKNYYTNILQASEMFDILPTFSSLLILPWDHSFAHTAGLYTLIYSGASISCVQLGKTSISTLKNIPKNIIETKPTFILSVPALAKNFKNSIEKSIEKKGLIKLFNFALSVSIKYFGNNYKREFWRYLYYPIHKFFDFLIYRKVREGFGGKLQYFVGGGALLDSDIQRFYISIGIPMYQGYGLSEASPIISANSPKRGYKIGSSGRVVPYLDIKIVDSQGNSLPNYKHGEIVVKGDNVMLGYWKNSEDTSKTIKDGWLHTGDLGYLDDDGFLYVLGRFKSLLIGNDGEKFSPEGIEEEIVVKSNLISQIMLHNNQNQYTIAIITLKDSVKSYYQDIENVKDRAKNIILDIENEIKEFKNGKYSDMFPARWLPTTFFIASCQFTQENKMINSTMKLVRRNVEDYYKAQIDYLYSKDGFNPVNSHNIDSLIKFLK